MEEKGHGVSRYRKGCRCVECKVGASEYRKKYRKDHDASRVKRHGGWGYRQGCRCDGCIAGSRAESARAKVLRGNFDEAIHRHGRSGYARGCRCEVCKSAQAASRLRGAPEKPDKCQCCDKLAFLVFDHNHATGKFRGWLCQGCNTGIGKLGDSIRGVERALRYLEER